MKWSMGLRDQFLFLISGIEGRVTGWKSGHVGLVVGVPTAQEMQTSSAVINPAFHISIDTITAPERGIRGLSDSDLPRILLIRFPIGLLQFDRRIIGRRLHPPLFIR